MLRHYCAPILIAVLLVGGCVDTRDGSDPVAGTVADSLPPPPTTSPATQPVASQNVGNVEAVTTAEALIWKTTSYAQELASIIDRMKKPAVAPVAPATAPSVKWVSPQTQPAVEKRAPLTSNPPATMPSPVVAVSEPDVQAPSAQRSEGGVQAAPPPAPMPTSDQLEQQLAKHIREYPRDVSAQLEYQVLQWLRGRQAPQMDVISSLSAEDRELIAAIMDGLSNFRSNVRGSENLLLSRKAKPWFELADRLRAQTSLQVTGVALCKKIYGFGAYDPLPSNRVTPGSTLFVYCEVENFASRLNDRGLWQTDITQEMVLYDDRGQRVAVEKRQPRADLSRNRRHDFCIARAMALPVTVSPGSYFLTVSVSDQQANRMAEATIPVQIVAKD